MGMTRAAPPLNKEATCHDAGLAGQVTAANTTGCGRTAHLRTVSSTATRLSLTLSPDKITTGGGLNVSVSGLAVTGAGEYRPRLRQRGEGPSYTTWAWTTPWSRRSGASLQDQFGWLALGMTGEPAQLDAAEAHLTGLGIEVYLVLGGNV